VDLVEDGPCPTMKKLRSITVNIHTSLYSARNCENESKAVERHVAADCSAGDYDNSMSSAQQNIYSALRHISVQGNNTTNNARCTKARKATHGLDGQHQDVGRTPCGRVNQNDRGQG